MKIDVNKFRSAFFEEAAEHLVTLETTLIELEANPEDHELIQRIFRAAHSLKGASGTFGFSDIARLTHRLEELLEDLRDRKFTLTRPLAGVLLRGADAARALVEAARDEVEVTFPEELLAEIAAARAAALADKAPPAAAPAPAATVDNPSPEALPPAGTRDVVVRFTPGPDLLRMGMDPLLVIRDLADVGEIRGRKASLDALPPLEAMDPEACYLTFSVTVRTGKSEPEIRDIFAFVEDTSEIAVIEPDDASKPKPAPAPEIPLEGRAFALYPAPIVRDAGDPANPPHPPGLLTALPPGALANPAPAKSLAAAIAPVIETIAPPAHGHGKPEGTHHPKATVLPGGTVRPGEHVSRGSAAGATLRVATDKVDRLVDLVGEVMIAQAMVVQAMNDPSPAGVERLREAMTSMERNTRELQERVMAVRMVPVGTVFSRFPRLVRDLAGQLGKKVSLELCGEDIELDKAMIEQLVDPLTHIVRNSLDHGVEPPEERLSAGKSETGILRLAAQHTGGSVEIEISDDGRGLQTDRILKKAIKNGLVRSEDQLSDDEIFALIFQPGFSTAEAVTDVSGRGVGMDVVKRNVEAMNGTVGVTSRPGYGTSIRIRLPLTLAVMDGLALRVGDQLFLLPLISIRESFRPKPAQVKSVLGKGEIMLVRGESIPLVRLHECFRIPDAVLDPTQAMVCIVETGSARVGLMVDEALGQSQVVVKSLENHFRKVEGIMGATIMGDGRVALILDATAIARQAGRTSTTKETRHGSDVRAA